MNPWDVFTWFNAGALLAGTSLVFISFLRDAGKILKLKRTDEE